MPSAHLLLVGVQQAPQELLSQLQGTRKYQRLVHLRLGFSGVGIAKIHGRQ
jgi:hypothetical protein